MIECKPITNPQTEKPLMLYAVIQGRRVLTVESFTEAQKTLDALEKPSHPAIRGDEDLSIVPVTQKEAIAYGHGEDIFV
jgi:hypothetical protein